MIYTNGCIFYKEFLCHKSPQAWCAHMKLMQTGRECNRSDNWKQKVYVLYHYYNMPLCLCVSYCARNYFFVGRESLRTDSVLLLFSLFFSFSTQSNKTSAATTQNDWWYYSNAGLESEKEKKLMMMIMLFI